MRWRAVLADGECAPAPTETMNELLPIIRRQRRPLLVVESVPDGPPQPAVVEKIAPAAPPFQPGPLVRALSLMPPKSYVSNVSSPARRTYGVGSALAPFQPLPPVRALSLMPPRS